MATPGKTGDKLLKDLEKTILYTRDLPNVDRFELNISCPNTHCGSGEMDARKEYSKQLKDMLDAVYQTLHIHQESDLKVSPDLTEEDVDGILETSSGYSVKGFTTTNTTTDHYPRFIPISPRKGGASGNAVYDNSLRVQNLVYDRTKHFSNPPRITACGGINSIGRLEERVSFGATEIQAYTGLIFTGPKLLRMFRESK